MVLSVAVTLATILGFARLGEEEAHQHAERDCGQGAGREAKINVKDYCGSAPQTHKSDLVTQIEIVPVAGQRQDKHDHNRPCMARYQKANENKKQPGGGGFVAVTWEAAHRQDGQHAADDKQPSNCVGNFSFVHTPPWRPVAATGRKPTDPKVRAIEESHAISGGSPVWGTAAGAGSWLLLVGIGTVNRVHQGRAMS